MWYNTWKIEISVRIAVFAMLPQQDGAEHPHALPYPREPVQMWYLWKGVCAEGVPETALEAARIQGKIKVLITDGNSKMYAHTKSYLSES